MRALLASALIAVGLVSPVAAQQLDWADFSNTTTAAYPGGGNVTVTHAVTFTRNGTPVTYTSNSGYPRVDAAPVEELAALAATAPFTSQFPGGVIGTPSALVLWNAPVPIGNMVHTVALDFPATNRASGDTLVGLGGIYPNVSPGRVDSRWTVTAVRCDGSSETDYSGWASIVPSTPFTATDEGGSTLSTPVTGAVGPTGYVMTIDNLATYNGNQDSVPALVRPRAGTCYSRVLLTRSHTTTTSLLPGGVSGVDGEYFKVYVAKAIPTVAGTVFQDTAGELLADGTVGSTSNPALSGRTVRLFNAGGTQLGTTTTAADGSYSFTGVAAGTHYVAVDAPTVNAAGNSTSILLEQTYAAAGTGNGGTAGGASGFGPLCVGEQPGYTQQGGAVSTNTASASGVVACYGGRRGAVADSGTTTLNDKEHVTRVVVGTANVTGVNFGFSPYVVTNVNDAGQGSIRQFALNTGFAATGGTYTMRVVPAVPTNASGGGGSWWRADLLALTQGSSVLMPQTDRVTIFNGTPHSNTNGTTVLDPMPGDMVPASTPVGNQGRTLGSIPRPDFMVNYTGAGGGNTQIITQSGSCAGSATRNIALNFTTSSAGALVMSPCGQYTLERTVMGARPDGVVATGSGNSGLLTNASTPIWTGQLNVRQNYIVNAAYALTIRNGSPGVTDGLLVEGNYIIGSTAAGISLERDGATVRGNYVANGGVGTAGIFDSISSGTGGHLITENTVTNNGRNLSLYKANETVTFNVITNASGATPSNGAGVVVADSAGIRISQNTFGGNTGNAIDLNRDGVSIATASGGNCPSSGTANAGMPRPRITASRLVGSTLTLSGFYCNAGTHTLEFYKMVSGTGDTGSDSLAAGEGVQYLGSLTNLSGGTFTNQTLTVSGLVASDRITAISIRADGSTSEFGVNVVLATGQLTLAKTWVNATVNDAVTVSVTDPAGVGTPLNAVAATANETHTGTAFDVVAGTTYTLTEAFTTGLAGDYGRALACTGNTGTGAALSYTANALTGTITIGSSATNVVCTFSNARRSRLTLIKTVTNDDTGTQLPGAWTLSATGPVTITGTTGSAAVTNALVTAGTYTLSESALPAGYSAMPYSCAINGGALVSGNSVTLASGDSAVCRIHNDDNGIPGQPVACGITSHSGANGASFAFGPGGVNASASLQNIVFEAGSTTGGSVNRFVDSTGRSYSTPAGPGRWLLTNSNGTTRVTVTFSPAIPAHRIGLAIYDIGTGSEDLAYIPSLTLALTGGATSSQFVAHPTGTVATLARYTPASGVVTMDHTVHQPGVDATWRQSAFLRGNANALVSTLTLTATNIKQGDAIGLGLVAIPSCVTIGKVTEGGVGTFNFTTTNVNNWDNTAAASPVVLTTSAPGTSVSSVRYPYAHPISSANQGTQPVTLSEVVPPGWVLSPAQCTDANSSRNGNTGSFGTLAGGTLTIPADRMRFESNITCMFTNTLAETDVRVEKTALPDPVVSGSVVTYTIVVNNDGPAAAHGTVLTDTPGAGLNCTAPSVTLVCTATGGAACPSATVPVSTLTGSGMTIPTLPAGGRVTATVQCTVTATGQP